MRDDDANVLTTRAILEVVIASGIAVLVVSFL